MFISYAPFLFYRLNGGIHRISFVYYSFRFHSFSEVRSQNKSQNLPSVFFFFFFFFYIYLSSLLFSSFLVTLLNHLPSVHYCTERTRIRTQSYMCMHTHVHAFLPSCIRIIHSFVYTIFLTLFRTLSLSLSLALSYSLLYIILSLSYFIYLFRSKKSEQ